MSPPLFIVSYISERPRDRRSLGIARTLAVRCPCRPRSKPSVTASNSSPSPSLQRTPLFPRIAALGAKTTAFSGWEMPVQFAGIRQEHEAVRHGIGVFDISHMGKFLVTGEDGLAAIDGLVPSDLSRLSPGQAQYTVLLNPEGGILDDLIVYRQTGDRVFLIVNAATRTGDRAWIANHLPPNIVLDDLTERRVLLALQGQDAELVLQPLVDADLSQLGFFEHCQTQLLGQPAFIARTGYTGEDGFEVMVSPETGGQLWEALMAADVTPCGLGARDTLRLEAALALYGQDIDPTTTPLEAGLKWLVHLDRKGEFIGRSPLERQVRDGVQRRLVGLKMAGRHIARHGYPVQHQGEPVGEITSGAPAPTLGYPIALAYVPTPLSKRGQILDVEIRGKLYPAEVVKKPFYRRR